MLLWGMLKQPEVPQQELELVTIESLVPGDHLLRKIEAAIDLEFIRDRVARPSVTSSSGRRHISRPRHPCASSPSVAG